MSTADQINDLIASNTDLKEYFEGVRDANEADRLAQFASVNDFINNTKQDLITGNRLPFDPNILFSKDGMALGSDLTDPTRTEWGIVDTNPAGLTCARIIDGLGVLSYSRVSINAPGLSENPLFDTDVSITKAQFIVGPATITSAEINNEIANANIELRSYGIGNAWGVAVPIAILGDMPGQGGNAKLFVRFVNEVADNAAVPANAAPQDIQTFGGNLVFGLHHVTQYQL